MPYLTGLVSSGARGAVDIIMGKIPRSRTSAILLLVTVMLVGDGVRAGSSVLENGVDQEEEVRAFIGQHQTIIAVAQTVVQSSMVVVLQTNFLSNTIPAHDPPPLRVCTRVVALDMQVRRLFL